MNDDVKANSVKPDTPIATGGASITIHNESGGGTGGSSTISTDTGNDTAIAEKIATRLEQYSHAIQNKFLLMSILFAVFCVLQIVALLGHFGIARYYAMETHELVQTKMAAMESQLKTQTSYFERIDKRHWELSRYIDLSQERSRKAKNDGTE